jgi:hypothetical protein
VPLLLPDSNVDVTAIVGLLVAGCNSSLSREGACFAAMVGPVSISSALSSGCENFFETIELPMCTPIQCHSKQELHSMLSEPAARERNANRYVARVTCNKQALTRAKGRRTASYAPLSGGLRGNSF